MSINVTVNGNPVNIRRGRMVLTDLDQIKKNERDRRRRLRLEQVRQQSKEISNRLLKRAQNIAKKELSALEKDDTSHLKRLHDKKIMEIQQKYQEDMADIGQAHASAALEPDADAIIEEEKTKNRKAAIKRGKEAMHQLKESQEKDMPQQLHQERLKQVRELENLRSSMVAKLPQTTSEEHAVCANSGRTERDAEKCEKDCPKIKKDKKILKRTPGKIRKHHTNILGSDHKIHTPKQKSKSKVARGGLRKSGTTTTEKWREEERVINLPSTSKTIAEETVHVEHIADTETEEKSPRKIVPNSSTSPTKADKIAKYNPEDYTQETTDSTSSETSSSISDDSSYFSDSGERPKCVKITKNHIFSADSRIQMYDHNTRQRNTYNKPCGLVEKIDVRNEPSAIDVAREVQRAESMENQLIENRKVSVRKRGEDAVLREKVRQDYQALMQNLEHISREERKLKASQIHKYPEDAYMQEQRRKTLKELHKKRLNHAIKTMLNNSLTDESPPRQAERIITLPARENEISDETLDAVWQEPFHQSDNANSVQRQKSSGKREEESREEQILEMLKKVERQKRLLLQEFGADLPNDIFNASVKPLFESQKPIPPPQNVPPQRPISPEIRVINMSCCDENVIKKRAKRKVKSPIKKVETAVQTASTKKDDTAQDKSIQVELIPKRCNESNSTSSDLDTPIVSHHPVDAKVTVITPDVDSSPSTNSTVTGVTINDDKEDVKVTAKKRTASARTASKRTPSRTHQKSRSMPVSKTSSPAKRFTKSLPGSRQSSPKKASYNITDTPTKRIDIYVNKGGFNITVEPTLTTAVGVGTNTESTQVFSVEGEKRSTDKPYRIKTQSRRVIKIKDTSDTSTSFASPPPIQPRNILDALSNNTPILEMLDSSANESLRMLRRDIGEISPVSTPDTPSPRTMMMPSNILHPNKISKMLKYATTDTQTNDSSALSSIKNDRSTVTDPFDYQQELTSSQNAMIRSKESSISPQACSCKNPACKLFHVKFDDIHDYPPKYPPHILEKYEDLQNVCSERIASLTDLIEKVRNEQKGLDFLLVSPGDETSLMQLPATKPMDNDLETVRRLVESIEAVHNQLARTLMESQRIIKNKVHLEGEVILEKKEGIAQEEIRKTSLADETISKDTTQYMHIRTEVQKAKAKPKIIKDEKVNIQLHRFKMQPRPHTLMPETTSERNSSGHPSKIPLSEEETIEKISKEILEQSKGLSRNVNTAGVQKDGNISLPHSSIKNVTQASTSTDYSKFDTSPTQTDFMVTTEKECCSLPGCSESKKNEDFVPLLAGIPKVPRTTGNTTSSSGRSKPPVTLHSGPYRTEIESSGHELSTIAEFDTPDTANKSQNNAKRHSPVKRSGETQGIKSSIAVKPSVHVAPLLGLHNQQLISGKSEDSSPVKLSSAVLGPAQAPQKILALSDSSKMYNDVKENNNLMKDRGSGSADQIPEVSNKKLQCDTSCQGLLHKEEELQPLSSISTDLNNQYQSNKDKITSTSSNSFSGLSGISEITSTPSSDIFKYASSPEEMEIALKKLGLSWAATTLKKTREACALSSSSNSDVTPIHTARRMISPAKKQLDSNICPPDISDVSSISIKEASKSTEQAVLLKGRTSTPKLQNSNSNSLRTNSSSINSSENFQEPANSLTVPNVSLTKTRSNINKLRSI